MRLIKDVNTKKSKARYGYPTKKQLEILYLIYRFRFVNTRHVQLELKQKNVQSAQMMLTLLHRKGYIGRNYNGRDRLAGRRATYYLLPSGMRIIRTSEKECAPKALRLAYKDRTATWQYADHQIGLGDIRSGLKKYYGSSLKLLFTKADLSRFDHSLTQIPDMLIGIENKSKEPDVSKGSTASSNYFFLDYYTQSLSFFGLKKRIKNNLTVIKDNELETELGSKLSGILLVCSTPRIFNRVIKLAKKSIERAYLDGPCFYVTTREKLLNNGNNGQIWTEIFDEDE